jgi:hypothetical protein
MASVQETGWPPEVVAKSKCSVPVVNRNIVVIHIIVHATE